MHIKKIIRLWVVIQVVIQDIKVVSGEMMIVEVMTGVMI